MRKVFLFVAIMAIGFSATAQTMKVQSAYSDMKNKRLGYAVKNIDEACEHEDTKADAKTWHYAGLIYTSLLDAAMQEDQKFFKKQKVELTSEQLANKAKAAFIKSIELEKTAGTNEFMAINITTLNNILITQLDFALAVFNKQQFTDAIPLFEEIVKSSIAIGKGGSEVALKSKYCIALAYEYTKQKDKATEIYRELAKSGSREEAVYISLYATNKAAKEMEKAINVLKIGRKNIPSSYKIIALLSGAYQETGNKEESNKNIEALINMADTCKDIDMKNSIYVLAGDSKRDAGSIDEALVIYDKALIIKPVQIEANFSKGVMYFNSAIDKIEQAQKIPETDMSGAYDKLIAESKETFKIAIPFFENVLSQNPNHYKTLNALKTIYSRLEMKDKYTEVSAKIEALRQGK